MINATLRPKTLIVSSWAPPMVGGPQNLYNLFSSIEGSFAIVTSRQNIDEAVKKNSIGSWLPCQYYSFDGYSFDQATIQSSGSSTASPAKKNALERVPLVGWRLSQLGKSLGGVYRALRGVQQLIRKHKFEVLFGVSDTGLSLIVTWLAGRITRTPYAVYLFDLYRGNLLAPPYSWLARWLERPIMTNAKFVIVTNEITEAYYQKRYGAKITTAVVHNSIFDRQTENDYHPTPPYTIVFTGNVYWAQEQAVMNIIAAMEKLSDLPITLRLFVPNAPSSLKAAIVGKSNIELGAASQDQMPAIQGAATLLFLPLAWDTKAPDIIATATPGKFTDYLDSGRPMLVHAPEYAYVSRYTKEHQLGLVVDTNSVADLTAAIRSFIANPGLGRHYVDNALTTFTANHEAMKNAAKLTSLLNLIK